MTDASMNTGGKSSLATLDARTRKRNAAEKRFKAYGLTAILIGLFFLGVLLLVGMLQHIEALDALLLVYQWFPPALANLLMGVVSAAIDNVPLTAALLKADITMSTPQWLALTYAVGVGGSLLVIGSAAGIVTMSKVKGLTFATYGKYSLLLLLAYCAGYGMVLLTSPLLL